MTVIQFNLKNSTDRPLSSTRAGKFCSTLCRRWSRANRGILVNKFLAVVVALLMGSGNGVFVYSGETHFWAERRKQARRNFGAPVLLASLPALQTSDNMWQNLPSVPSSPFLRSLPAQIEKNISPEFFQRNVALLSALSREYGTIRKISMGSSFSVSGPVVVHIQDVHQNPDAQRNIGAVVRQALVGSGVGVLALEGFWGQMNLTPFRDFKNPKGVQQAADYLLKENLISGPIHGVLTGTGPLPAVVGVDDPLHYNANVEAYRQSAPRREAVQKEIRAREGRIEKRKDAVYSPALREFDRRVEAYREGRSSLGEYATAMATRAGSRGLPPSLQDFSKALAMERALDFRQVEKERSLAIQRLLERVTPEQESGLVAQAAAYRAGKLSYADFYTLLKTLCEKAGVPLVAYPSLDNYVRYVLLADQIDAEVLFKDLQRVENDRYDALAKSPEEKRLVMVSRKTLLTKKLLEFSLTPEEWKTYVSLGLSVSRPEEEAGDGSSSLGDLGSFERFYQEAQARDALMAAQLLQAMKRNGGVAILVTGGFHSAGVTDRLTDAGVTVVSFVPKIEKVDVNQGPSYLSVFTQEKTPLDQLFQGEKLFLATHPARPSVVRGLLPALVVLVALWAGGYWAEMDPTLLYYSLGGVGLLAGVKLFTDHADATLKTVSGSLALSVQMDKGTIMSVKEGLVKRGWLIFIPNSPVGSRDSTKKSGLFPSQKSLSVVRATTRTFLFVIKPAFFVSVLAPNWGIRVKKVMTQTKDFIRAWMGTIPSEGLMAKFVYAERKTQILRVLIPFLLIGGALHGGFFFPDLGINQITETTHFPILLGLALGNSLVRKGKDARRGTIDFKKIEGLYAALAQLMTLSEEISASPTSRLDPSNEEDFAKAVKFKDLLNEVISKGSELSPEFKTMVEESDGDVEIGKLMDMLSRHVFIPAGRCLPWDWKKNKSPLVIENESWTAVEYLGQKILFASVFPFGRGKSPMGMPGLLGLKGFVFLDTAAIRAYATSMWKTLRRVAPKSGNGSFAVRVAQSKLTERELHAGQLDWFARRSLVKSKDVIYAAEVWEKDIPEVTLADELSAILLPGGPAERSLKEEREKENVLDKNSSSSPVLVTQKSYAEFLEAFYEHLVALSDLGPEKAHLLAVISLAEVLNDMTGDHPYQKGARLFVDQLFSKAYDLANVNEDERENHLSFFYSEKFPDFHGLFQVVEEMRNENLVRQEDRFYRLFNRPPHRTELAQLYSHPLTVWSGSGRTVPLSLPQIHANSLTPLAVNLLSRAKNYTPSHDPARYGSEAFALLQEFNNLRRRYSTAATVQSFKDLLRELSGGEDQSRGLRSRSRRFKNVEEVELNAMAMEDFLLEVADKVFLESMKRAQELSAQGNVEGGIQSLLDVEAVDSLMETLPPSSRETLNALLESARTLLRLATEQKILPVSEIIDQKELFGLDEVETAVLRTLSSGKSQGMAGVRGSYALNSWGMKLLCQRLGKHAPDALLTIRDEMTREEESAQKELTSPPPLGLYGGFAAFVSDDVFKSELWKQHRQEILRKLNKFLKECVDDQEEGKKEKIDVAVGGLLLGRDLWGIHRGYLPAARFYFRVFDETGSDGEKRRGVYVIAVENKGDSSEKGGNGRINSALKARLEKGALVSGSGNREVFGNYKPVLPEPKKGREKNAAARDPLAQNIQLTDGFRQQGLEKSVRPAIDGSPVPTGKSRLGMHLVGGAPLIGFQRDFLFKRAPELASRQRRASWADQIDQALEDPLKKKLMDFFGLAGPVTRLISLLRMESPTIEINGVILPVRMKLLSGTPNDLWPEMPRAFAEVVWGNGRTPSHATLVVYPDDLAAVLHEGMEVLLQAGLFGKRYGERAHTLAFLTELLANDASDGLKVPKRAYRELEEKSSGELLDFLKKGVQSLKEIKLKFNGPSEGIIRDRLIVAHSKLTEFALAMFRERKKKPASRIVERVAEGERRLALGSLADAEVEMKGLLRALSQLERERGARPLLSHYVDGRRDRLRRIHSDLSEPQLALAQRYSPLLFELELLMRKREWVSLWQNINRLRMSRAFLGQESEIQEQAILSNLWDKIGLTLTPVMRNVDWDEADREVFRLEAYGREVIQNFGIENQYFERLLFDYLAIYRAQRDLAHRKASEAEHFKASVGYLVGVSLGGGPVSDSENEKLETVFAKMRYRLNEWEVRLMEDTLKRLSRRLTGPTVFQLQGIFAPSGLESHIPFLQRILMKYAALRISPKEISDVFSRYLTGAIPIDQAISQMVEWGISRPDAELLFLDLNELKPRVYGGSNSMMKAQRGEGLVELLSGMTGLFALSALIPLLLGKGSLTLSLASLGITSILGIGGVAMVLGLGFVGTVWWGKKFIARKGESVESSRWRTAQSLISLLQEQPTSLGVDGRSVVESGFQYGDDRRFLSSLRTALREKGKALSFAQVRHRLAPLFDVRWGLDSPSTLWSFGDGDKPLTIVYLDGASIPSEGTLISVLGKVPLGSGAEVVVIPVDEKARMASKSLAGRPDFRVLDSPTKEDGNEASTGPWYRLARVEQTLSTLGVNFDQYTGCRVVAPVGLDFGVDGVKSELFRQALVVLMHGLNQWVVRRIDLDLMDRLARAVASAA